RLSPVHRDRLMSDAMAYRMGQMRHTDFYRRLRDLCQSNQVPLSRFPAMDGYVRYVLLAESIDSEALFAEIKSLEAAHYQKLIRASQEAALVSRGKDLYLAGKLVDFSLTKEEWEEYKVGGLGKLPPFESFYLEAEARDAAMAAHVLGLKTKGSIV